MALTNCPECRKEISDASQNCPQCGYPLAATKAAAQAKVDAAKAAEQAKALKVKTDKAVNKGCFGCLGVIAILVILGWIVGPSSSSTSDSWQSGRKIGFVDGNMAMRQGRQKETDAEKEAAAWSVASGFTQNTQKEKQDWVNGYEIGWDDGYASH